MLIKKQVLFFLLFMISVSFIHGAVFENATKYQITSTNYTVTYTLNLDLNLTSIEVYDTGIILNGTHNLSFIPNNQSLNITLLNWTDVNNSFRMQGANQSVQWTIKVSNNNQSLQYNHTNQTNSVFTAYDSNYDWNYSVIVTQDLTAPTISTISDTNTTTAISITMTLGESGNSTAYLSTSSTLSSPTTNSITNYVTSHNYTFTGLTNNTIYYYKVNGSDSSGNYYNSAIRNVTTSQTTQTTAGSSGTSDGGGSGNPISTNLTSLQITGKQPLNTYAITTTDKFSYNFGEPITTTAETWLKVGQDVYGSQSDILINAQSVKVKILSHNVSFGEYELQQDSIGKYKAIIDNKLEEGQYTMQFNIKTYDGEITKEQEILVTRFASLTDVVNTGNTNLNLTIIYLIVAGLIIGTVIGIAMLLRKR